MLILKFVVPTIMKSDVFNFLVLGAGAAGCAVASRLAAKHPDASIALLEIGSRRYTPSVMRIPFLQPFITQWPGSWRFLHRYAGVPEDNLGGRSLTYVRGRGLGGSTLCNDMTYRRGSAEDFAAWGDDAWTFAKMLPFFTSLECNSRSTSPVHGDAGPIVVSDLSLSNLDSQLNIRFFEACEAAGLRPNEDLNGGLVDGFSAYQSLIDRGVRVDLFDACIEKCKHLTPHLSLWSNTNVERITFDDTNRTQVTGVEVRRGGVRRWIKSPRIIVCLGAIGSPALLLRSGIGPQGSVVDLPEVGQNLIQGCTADLIFLIQGGEKRIRSKSFNWTNLPYIWGQWKEYNEDRAGILSSFAEAVAYVRSQPTQNPADLSIAFFRTPQLGWRNGVRLRPHEGFTLRITHHYPQSRGEVRLHPRTGKIQVRSGMLSEKDDVLCMDMGIQWAGLLVAKNSNLRSVYYTDNQDQHVGPFAALDVRLVHPSRGMNTQKETAAFLGKFSTGSEDLFGTCALQHVVDSQMKVQGIEGLWVADASVVPLPTTASSSVLGAAIGARVATLIA
ncbi:unnamed protein product [Phytomonas sp. Hart1]|nr:unnamed protein product [Phytomonas sp. Hart1]|eukprot:CCW69298.1 unnamed protein product [Phytomonas sp. isolate Hart1]